jgi:hypothetical protein
MIRLIAFLCLVFAGGALLAQDDGQIFLCCYRGGQPEPNPVWDNDPTELCYTSISPEQCDWGFWTEGSYPDFCDDVCGTPSPSCDESGTCVSRGPDSVCNFECPPPAGAS